MANNHHHNNRPHHPLWGLVSTPWRLLMTLAVMIMILAIVIPMAAAVLLANLVMVLMPFAGAIAFGLVIWIGFRTMFHRPNRRGRDH